MKDNRVSQTALEKTSSAAGLTGAFVLVEGVVVDTLFPDNEHNRSQNRVEYSVEVTSVANLGLLLNVPRCDLTGGIDDGDEHILRAADGAKDGTAFIDGGDKSKNPTPRHECTGDRVLVGFVNGNPNRPVIVGVLSHASSRINKAKQPMKDITGKVTLSKKGERFRRTRHRGTEMVMNDNGDVTVNFAKRPDKDGKDKDDKKKLTINIGDLTIVVDNTSSPTKATFKLKDGNDIMSLDKEHFKLGAADEPMVLGNVLATLLDKFIGAYNAHTHTGNMGAPTPMTPDGMVSESAAKVKSDWAKLSKAKP